MEGRYEKTAIFCENLENIHYIGSFLIQHLHYSIILFFSPA
jgi:hypothetical protein